MILQINFINNTTIIIVCVGLSGTNYFGDDAKYNSDL